MIFVLCGGTALAASVLLPKRAGAMPFAAAPAAATGSHLRLARWPDLDLCAGLENWRRYVGELFVQTGMADPATLVLRQVVQRHVDRPGEQFSLLFAALAKSTQPVLLRHCASGQQVPVLVQPAGTDAQGLALYRADFYRLSSGLAR